MTYNIISTQHESIDDLDPRQYIIIKGAKVNNLKSVDVAIKRNSLTVITGLSGSGKSSLAFDTLYAEGQRMYVESLSSYARQFLGRMEKPEVEYIKGISPAIAIEQKVTTKNPRSTVGTTTEIYDYFKLLFARIGRTLSPVSGNEVKKDSVTDVVNYLFSHEEGTRFMIMTPFKIGEDRGLNQELDLLLKKGYTRLVAKGEILQIEDIIGGEVSIEDFKLSELFILIDRAVIQFDENGNPDEDTQYRLSDSIQTAFFEGEGDCVVLNPQNPTPALPNDGEGANSFRQVETSSPSRVYGIEGGVRGGVAFSDRFELDGMTFEEPSVNLFTFNNPYGACRRCEGFGNVLGLDPELVIPDKNLSVFEGAIAPWRSEKMSEWLAPLIRHGIKFDFPIHREYKSLTEDEQHLLWTGNKYFDGLDKFFSYVEAKAHKVQYRVMLSRYRGRTVCPECRGSRLRGDASYVKIHGKSIIDLVLMSIRDVSQWFQELELTEQENAIGKRILIEIQNRLNYMERVGLGYLTLNRLASTLSGGESQRIRLATSLGSALVGSMYILDEPSIGLHPRDTQRLISVLESLRDIGNTVIVVEHEEEVMRAADDIIDIGPDAGKLGGDLIFQGKLEVQDLAMQANKKLHNRDSPFITAEYERWKVLKEFARSNRKNQTEAEAAMWKILRGKKVKGLKFRRQHAIEEYIVDFVCLEKRLVVEIDGKYHDTEEQKDFDNLRTQYLNYYAFEVIRFTNDEVLNDIESVIVAIEEKTKEMFSLRETPPQPSPEGRELLAKASLNSPLPTGEGSGVGSHTLRFLSGEDTIEVPKHRRKATDFIEIIGAKENNLKDISVKFPLGNLTVVTGVSGSGKSTLVRSILYPAMMRGKGNYAQDSGKFRELKGDLSRITQVEMVDQNPIGKSSRSNPVTYIKAYDAIRALMSDQHLSKVRDYKPAFFSFNVDGGRCEACQGEGQQTIEMQFMADVKLICESCKGKRFKQEILEVTFNEKSIADILDMTIDEAIEFFAKDEPKIAKRLQPLQDVGLGYIGLGQSSNTLSGGEAQRVKLAYFLSKGNADTGKTLFIFDEPTTGLHFHDIRKLLKALNALVEQGDSVIVIEHNMEIIKSADWVIDLGPDGGDGGGYLQFEGTPEEMAKIEGNYTADFLKEKILIS